MSKIHELPIWSRFNHFDIKEHTILLGWGGSFAYGTNTDNSDKDLLGCFIAPAEYYYGLHKMDEWRLETEKIGEETWDATIYEIRKLFHLWLVNNPHTLQLLWLQPHCYLHISPYGKQILENRQIFMSKRIYKSFIGYSRAQLDLCYKQAKGLSSKSGLLGKKRKDLIDKFGWDVKAGSQMIRLLRTCLEALTTGELNVWRHDHRELKSIKNGEWSIEQLEEESKRLFALADEAFVRSTLPNEPDFKKAEELLISITKHNFAFGE